MVEPMGVTRRETISPAAMWFGVLAAPIAWAVQLLLNYGLEDAVACAPGSRASGEFLGMNIGTFIQMVNVVATVVTVSAFAVAYRSYRRLRDNDATDAQRASWMAVAGMFVSGIFLVITALKFASPLFLRPCSFVM